MEQLTTTYYSCCCIPASWVSIFSAFKDTSLVATTTDIPENGVQWALSKRGASGCRTGVTEPHAPADNVSVVQVPVIIAHRPPGSIVKHLNSTLPIGRTRSAD